MTDTREIISMSLLFQDLPDDQLDRIQAIGVNKIFQRGDVIFSDGDEGDGFYLVMDGQIKIFKLSPDGKEQILHIFTKGEPFGEVPVFSGQRFPANAQAIKKSSVFFFPREDFVSLITSNPSMSLNMLAVLSKRLRQFTTQVENLSLKEVPARLATYLIYLVEEQGQSGSVTLTISKGQLASLLGTIPETLSRIFARMNGQGIIEVKDRTINILDYDSLVELAETGKQ